MVARDKESCEMRTYCAKNRFIYTLFSLLADEEIAALLAEARCADTERSPINGGEIGKVEDVFLEGMFLYAAFSSCWLDPRATLSFVKSPVSTFGDAAEAVSWSVCSLNEGR